MEWVEINQETFENENWEKVIENSRRRECNSYSLSFITKRKEAEENGKAEIYTLYDLLALITSYVLKPEGRHQVFVPVYTSLGTRNPIPEDIPDHALDLLESLYPDLFSDNELGARIGDTLWLRKKNFSAAKSACIQYLKSCSELSVYSVTKLTRAFDLSKELGKGGKKEKEKIVSFVERKIEEHKDDTPNLYLVRDLIELLIDTNDFDSDKYQTLSNQIGDREKDDGDSTKSRAFWELAAKIANKSEDFEIRDTCYDKIGKSFEEEAELHDSHMLKANSLHQAIEAYRKVPGADERRSELHIKLLQVQSRIPEQMKKISSEQKIPSDIVDNAIDLVKDKSTKETLLNFALVATFLEPETLKKRVKEQSEQYPMRFLITGTQVNDDGKTTAIIPSLLTSDPEQYEEALEAHAIRDMNLDISLSVSIRIIPAKFQITLEHVLSARELMPLLHHNPLVKPGYEEIVLKGVLAGFYDDWITAAHIIPIQFEQSLRYYLSINGRITSTLDNHGIQQEKSLEELLKDEFLQENFGEDLIFTIKQLLIGKYGPNLRNEIAHGLKSTQRMASADVVYTWWLYFRLLVTPALINERKSKSKDIG